MTLQELTILAVIPARGGSKGLPRKNIRALAGLPLIVHSIRCAALCPAIDRCIVSTDDEEIAAVARQHGGCVPFMRPSDLAGDETPMIDVLQHALRAMEAHDERRYDAVLLLDPTSPGRLPDDVARAIAIFVDDPDTDGVVGCSRPTFNPLWVGRVERDGYLEPLASIGTTLVRRQDAPVVYRINGQLYLFRRDSVLRGAWPAGRYRLLETPERRAFAIDEPYEFELAAMCIENGLIELPWLDPAG